MFITATAYQGNLGGLTGADAKCQAAADAADLPGTYKAWLADTTGTPSTRFYQSPGPYRLVNGTTIANNWADLTDGALLAPINLTETNTPNDYRAWTNATPNGALTISASDFSCTNWSTIAGAGQYGSATQTDGRWTEWPNLQTQACIDSVPLYCFQQSASPPP